MQGMTGYVSLSKMASGSFGKKPGTASSASSASSGGRTDCAWASRSDDTKFLDRSHRYAAAQAVTMDSVKQITSHEVTKQFEKLQRGIESFWSSSSSCKESLDNLKSLYRGQSSHSVKNVGGHILDPLLNQFARFARSVDHLAKKRHETHLLEGSSQLRSIQSDFGTVLKYLRYINDPDPDYAYDVRLDRLKVAITEVSLRMDNFLSKVLEDNHISTTPLGDSRLSIDDILYLSHMFPKLDMCTYVHGEDDSYNCFGEVFNKLGIEDKEVLLMETVHREPGPSGRIRLEGTLQTLWFSPSPQFVEGKTFLGVMYNDNDDAAHIFLMDRDNPYTCLHKLGSGLLIEADPYDLEPDPSGCFGYGKIKWYTPQEV